MKTIREIAQALETGTVKSRELVEHCLANIENPDGEGARTFIAVHKEKALAEADWVDQQRARGRVDHPFLGIPLSIKDLFDEAGQVSKAGSKALAGARPADKDAVVISRLREAGFILIGRTNMTEFAYSGLGLNPHYGTPLNPYDRDAGRIPGGSSSGAAVSVTDNMAYAGLGTDTGGSCRIPAALCGIVGFKPTASRISQRGVVPLSSTLDAAGPLANSVDCCRIVDGVISGEVVEQGINRPVKGMRFAVPQALVLEGMDDQVSKTFEAALSKLSAQGALIEELPMDEFNRFPEINAKGGFAAAEAYAWHRDLLSEKGDHYDPRVSVRIFKGEAQSAADYIDLLGARKSFIRSVKRQLAAYDAMLLPAVPQIAPTMEAMKDDETYGATNLLMLRNPSVINFLDGCAISIPCHKEGEAPVGLMVAGMANRDSRILSIAEGIEKLF